MKKSKASKDSLASSVRISQGTYQKTIITKLASQIFIGLIAVFILYLCFAATVLRFTPAAGGMNLVKNNTYPGGSVPAGAQLVVTPGVEVGEGSLDRLKQSFVPQSNSSIVEVLAGPNGKVKWTSGVLTVSGKPVDLAFPTDPGIEVLANQYVAVCIKGSCVPGTPIIFEQNEILGVVLGKTHAVPAPPTPTVTVTGRPTVEQIEQALTAGGVPASDAGCYAKIYHESNLSDTGLADLVNGTSTGFKGRDKTILDNNIATEIFYKCDEKG